VRNILPNHAIPLNLIEEAEKNVKKNLEKANATLSMNLRFEGVKFFSRSKMAGYVIPSRDNIVYLNLDLFKANFPQFVKDTIPHEVAHLFAYSLVGRSEGHHGATWKSVMRNVFRIAPNRTHSFDLSVVDLPKSQYKYICVCQKHFIGTRIHNQIQQGRVYKCRNCKKDLTFLAKND
jgi:SprT protein